MSEERGRDQRISTGRGGAGNLVRSLSRGPDPDVIPGAERGRELRDPSVERVSAMSVSPADSQVTHAGRGGAGNIRSPSRDPKRSAIEEANEDALQEQLIAERRGREADLPTSSGRGGAGNITSAASRSRSRSAVREANSSPARIREASRTRLGPTHAGRGGYGNITEDIAEEDLERRAQEQRYEQEVRRKYEEEEVGKQYVFPVYCS